MTATSPPPTSSSPSTAGRPAPTPLGRRRVAWAGVLAVIVALLAVAVVDQGGVESDAERIERLSDSFACPQCQGESVSESNAAVAAEIRDFIAAEVARGATDTEIRDRLIQSYGVQVLLTPPADGLAALVWVLPVVAAAVGGMVVAALFARSRRPSAPVTDADRALVEEARQRWRDDQERDR